MIHIEVKAFALGSNSATKIPLQYIDEVKQLRDGGVQVAVGHLQYFVPRDEWTKAQQLVGN
jgi:hypothetical protein